MMNLSDVIKANEGFQTSVNIEYDFGMPSKIESLIPTDTVCTYVEDILGSVINQSNQRAESLVAPYGTGKSHITLVALSAMWFKEPSLYTRIVEAYEKRGSSFGKSFAKFVEDGPKLLPVIISGNSSDLRHSLLYSLRAALRLAGLEELMPKTNYDGALEAISIWRNRFPDTLNRFESEIGSSAEMFESRLRNMDTDAYNLFVSLYPQLTSGSQFDSFANASVVELYDKVLEQLSQHGLDGIFVVYDEFSKYLEANIANTSMEDIKLLQDFAEKCNRSIQKKQLHFLVISHKTLSNYIDEDLPKSKRDGWRTVSGRFREVEIRNDANQSYELISKAILKDEKLWSSWLNDKEEIIEAVKQRYLKSKSSNLFDGVDEDMIAFGCYPLHPTSTCLLPRLSAKIAQNERTLFTYLCSSESFSLQSQLDSLKTFVSPDSIYDYFEPLLRKEPYDSPIHRVYELSMTALQKTIGRSLESKIIKTIALIRVVEQYHLLAPTKHSIIEIYVDCGYGREEVEDAIDNLVNTESIVYLRESNGYLKLKETSGVNIEESVLDRASQLREKIPECAILNSSNLASAIYPSKYNENHDIIRYFNCGFLSKGAITNGDSRKATTVGGDGVIIAVVPDSLEEMEELQALAEAFTKKNTLSVVVIPRSFRAVSNSLYRYAAAKELKEQAKEDAVLAEEYQIILEDSGEIIADYISGFFRPEYGRARYYARGKEQPGVTRRRKLSDLISELCEKAFPFTPRITHETLNKNTIDGNGLSSRSKIIASLCSVQLEENLGFIGTGQEVAMARSALLAPGIIQDLKRPIVNLAPADENMRRVLTLISDFVLQSNNSSFSEIYDALMGPSKKIGMKKGPIILYLALILREHRDEVIISYNGVEKPLTASTLDDIDAHPENYQLSLLNWSDERALYVSSLAKLFKCETTTSRAQIAESMRLWFVRLPQLTRNAQIDHTGSNDRNLELHRGFLNLLKRVDIDSSQLLFEALPRLFDCSPEADSLIAKIKDEKEFCDGYIGFAANALSSKLKNIFMPQAPKEASLDSVLKDWAESLPDDVVSYVFQGVTQQIFNAIKTSSPNDEETVRNLAKAATSLRLEDWNDERFDDFISLIQSAKGDVESLAGKDEKARASAGQQRISFYDGDIEQVRTFETVECSPRAELLRHNVLSCLEEVGRSLPQDEKRQIVFEILRGLC